MALKSFFGLLTLQVGATILAAVFFTLAALMLMTNVYYAKSQTEDSSYKHFALLFVLITSIAFIIIGVLAFLSSYHENRAVALAAFLAIIVVLVFWLILSVLSFISSPSFTRDLCVFLHCPETFWLVPLMYKRWYVTDEVPANKTVPNPPPRNDSVPARISADPSAEKALEEIDDDTGNDVIEDDDTDDIEIEHVEIDNIENDFEYITESSMALFKRDLFHNITFHIMAETGNDTHPATNNTNWEYLYNEIFLAAIIFFIINLLFLIYSAMVLWGWAKELEWCSTGDYDDDDIY